MFRNQLALLSLLLVIAACNLAGQEQPNILWLSSEDHGPQLGCYGDDYATTPNIDRFAATALLYTQASSNVPVCAPARTTIISGMYAPSTGSQHMRSKVPTPAFLKFFPVYLQEAGYYTSNNDKEDYNLLTEDKGWDESSEEAHWKNAPNDKPFFAVFNFFGSHESQIRNENQKPLHDPALAPVPPYHPDTPKVRKDWAQYYDRLTLLDDWIAGKLTELEDAGLADDTIVMLWGDHGSGMPRSKRYPGWSGLHVPVILHIPEKYKHLAPEDYLEGGTSDRLISFVDFAPTMLSLGGVNIPDYYQGHAFLGKNINPKPEYSFGFKGRMDERPDFCRSVMDGHFIYIRNFYPQLPHGQFVWYQQQTTATAQWYQMFKDGELNDIQSVFWKPRPKEELFDLRSDYHETNNLADSPEHQSKLEELRSTLLKHMVETKDLGIIPEPILRKAIVKGESPLETFAEDLDKPTTQWLMSIGASNGESLRVSNTHSSSYRKYWAIVNSTNASGKLDLDSINTNIHPTVPLISIAAAELVAIHTKSEKTRINAINTLIDLARYPDNELILSLHALNALERVKDAGIALPESVKHLTTAHESIPQWADTYRLRIVDRL